MSESIPPRDFWVQNLKKLDQIHVNPMQNGEKPNGFVEPNVAALAFILLCHLEEHHGLKGRPKSEIEKFLES